MDVDGFIQPSGVLESAGKCQSIPTTGKAVSGGKAVSSVFGSVVSWGRGHQLSGRAQLFRARPPHS